LQIQTAALLQTQEITPLQVQTDALLQTHTIAQLPKRTNANTQTVTAFLQKYKAVLLGKHTIAFLQ
jgi:hypothetical protein